MRIDINGTKHPLPLSWCDIKVSRYAKVLEYWGEINPETRNKLEQGDELPHDTLNSFLVGWAYALWGVDIDTLKLVDSDGLKMVFSLTNYLLGAPKDFERITELQGVEITASVFTSSGAELVGAKCSYEQWMLINQVGQIMKPKADFQNVLNLKRMLSIIHPVKNEEQNELNSRLSNMDNITALQLWSGFHYYLKMDEWVSKLYPIFKERPKDAKGKELKGSANASPTLSKFRRLKNWQILAHEVAKTGVLGFNYDRVIAKNMRDVLKHIEIELSLKL